MAQEKHAENPDIERYRFSAGLLAPSNWLTWFGLLLFFLFTLLPLPVVDSMGEKLGRFVARRNRKRFKIVCRNLEVYKPGASSADIEAMAMQHFAMQFRGLLHYFMIWWRPNAYLDKHLVSQGYDKLLAARQQGRNMVLLLSHSVGLEFAVAAITRDLPSTGIYKKMPNPVIEWLIVRGRRRFANQFGSRIFNRDDGLRPVLRELKDGKALIYLADEDLGEDRSVFAPLFGMQKATIPLLGRLARLGKADVFPCICCYDKDHRRYVFKVLDAIEGLGGKDELADSTLMNQAIERSIEECPLQYLWTLRYFHTRPDGGKSIYE